MNEEASSLSIIGGEKSEFPHDNKATGVELIDVDVSANGEAKQSPKKTLLKSSSTFLDFSAAPSADNLKNMTEFEEVQSLVEFVLRSSQDKEKLRREMIKIENSTVRQSLEKQASSASEETILCDADIEKTK